MAWETVITSLFRGMVEILANPNLVAEESPGIAKPSTSRKVVSHPEGPQKRHSLNVYICMNLEIYELVGTTSACICI